MWVPELIPTICPSGPAADLLGLWGHMCRLLSAYRTSSDAWCSWSLGSGLLRELSNLCCVLSLEKLKTFETKTTWPPSVAGLGYACSRLGTTCLALQTLLYHNLFFYREEMFSIINHVVLAFPEPSPWKGDPELVSGSLLSAEAPSSHGEKGRRSSLGLFKVRGAEWTHLLWWKGKRIKDWAVISLYGVKRQFQTKLQIFFLWQWFWKGIHIILAI